MAFLGKIVQGLAAGVGLASESIQHHKERKRLKNLDTEETTAHESTERHDAPGDSQAYGDVPSPRALDEEAWQLDEMEVELTNEAPPLHEHSLQPNHFPETATRTVDEPNLTAAFIGEHPLPSPSATPVTRRLELPVVLTQRRPKARARGFVRAYAPVLDDVGIDQPTLLDFVDKLNKAVEPNPWIQAINLASLAAQNVPEPVSMAVAIACKIVADAASEVHSRTKTNAFLDTVNQEFFKPRGLVAVLVAWKPSDPSVLMDVDFSLGSKIANASPPENRSSYGKLKHRLQSSSGASSFEFPNTAPLIFPAVDELAASTSESPEAEANKQNAIKRGGNFVNDYMDRRAVAKWAGDHPESKMANAQRKPEFHSRYADPTHSASSGDLVAFVTGGKFTSGSIRDGGLGRQSISDGRIGAFEARGTGQRGFGRGSILDGRVAALQARGRGFSREAGEYAGPGAETSRRRQSEALAPGAPGEDARSRQQQIPVRLGTGRGGMAGTGLGPLSLVGPIKKLLQNDVLYLIIVNRPTEEEINEATARFQGD